MSILIAEIGNNHLGDFDLAKQLIREAARSGATLVKGQAFSRNAVQGSMPADFYEQCRFTEDQYIELIYYARLVGIDMFYSIFGVGFEHLRSKQTWNILSASQSRDRELVEEFDRPDTFISVNRDSRFPKINDALILCATEYNNVECPLRTIRFMSNFYNKSIGLSDHSIDINICIDAITRGGVKIIEKHFCLEKQKNNIKYKGVLFRDSEHAMTPKECSMLKSVLTKGKK